MQYWNTETNTWDDPIGGIIAVGAIIAAVAAVFAIAYGNIFSVILMNICFTLGILSKIRFAGPFATSLCTVSVLVTLIAIYQIVVYGEYSAPVGLVAFVMLVLNGYAFAKKEIR